MRVGSIITEQMERDAIRDAQRARQHRAVLLLYENETTVDQRAPLGQARAHARPAAACPGELEGEPDARASPREIVMQVAVQSLEARVGIGRERNHEQLDLDGFEAK